MNERRMEKGDFNYLSHTKKRQRGLVILLALTVLVIFLAGLWFYRQPKNPVTIVAAVMVVPFASALIRLVLLERFVVNAAETQAAIELVKQWQKEVAGNGRQILRCCGPAVYTFDGRAWPIVMVAVVTDIVYIRGIQEPKTAQMLELWLHKQGFTAQVRELSEGQPIPVTDEAADQEATELLYRYIKTLIV